MTSRTEKKEKKKKNIYEIKVFSPSKVRERWDETDSSEDAFVIEPTKIGDYYRHQTELHDEI